METATVSKNMHRYVAFLRGINVGGNKTIRMTELKKCFEDCGYADVTTYINSGNVIFSSDTADTKGMTSGVEKAIKETFGFSVAVIVRTQANILMVNDYIPAQWTNDAEQKTDVIFLQDAYDNEKTVGLIKTTKGVDTLVYVPGAIVWNLKRKEYTKSGMHSFIGTPVYNNMTARNVNTVRKLAVLCAIR